MPADENFSYYSTHDFHNNNDIAQCFQNGQTFSVINCNIRSLSANFDSLASMLSELYFPFSLIGLTETKIKVDQSPITNTELPGFSFISQPSYLNAGGVGFYISNKLDFNILSDFTKSTDDFEALWIEVQNIGHPNLLCGILYRHPNGNLDNFTEYLSATIDKINCSSKFCTVMGDFNLDLLQVNSHKETDDFLNILGSSFFLPQILQPTRITYHSATLIDNIFFNSLEHFTISGNIAYDLTNHLANFLVFNKFDSLPSSVKLFRRDYSTFNQQALISEMQLIDRQQVFTTDSNPSSMFSSFYSEVSSIIDRHIPVKQLSRKELKLKSKPWITPALRKSLQDKNNLYKKFLKSKSIYYHSKFKVYGNKLNHLLRISKIQYYNQYFYDNISDGKKIWKGIKQIIHFKPTTSLSLIKIVNNNKEFSDPKHISDAFNNI